MQIPECIRSIVARDLSLDHAVRDEIYLWILGDEQLGQILNGIITAEIKQAIFTRKEAYENTILEIASTLSELNIEYCLIKALRRYPHINTDVNIVVNKSNFRQVIESYKSKGWSDRSYAAKLKESLAERGKRKIVPPKGSKYADIHLYPCATWHGVKYISYDWIMKNTVDRPYGNSTVRDCNDVSDLLINYGHCLFERYNLSLGELYHNQMVRQSLGPSGLAYAHSVAVVNGWGDGFKYLDQFIDNWWHSADKQGTPLFLPRADLRRFWLKRSLYNFSNGNYISAIEEPLANFLWLSPFYDAYRLIKRRLGNRPINPKSFG